jgi:twinfilin-like protein
MVYSSGALLVFQSAKSILADSASSVLAAKKIETSDPTELDEGYLKTELGVGQGNDGGLSHPMERLGIQKPFSKPKGPGRRR